MQVERGDKFIIKVNSAKELDSDYKKCKEDYLKVEVTHPPGQYEEKFGVKPVDESFSYFLFLWCDSSCIAGCIKCNSSLIYHDSQEEWICPFCEL